jgi:hypothetical protein
MKKRETITVPEAIGQTDIGQSEAVKSKDRYDLKGKHFGKLTVLYYTGEIRNGSRVWHCRCECGNYVDITARNLNRGAKSCGCLRHRAPGFRYSIENNLHLVDGTCIENLISSQKRPIRNKSGVRGVYPTKDGTRFIAAIEFKGKKHYLGTFRKLSDAAKARRQAEDFYFRPFLENYTENFKKH